MFDTVAPDFIGRVLVMPLAWFVPAIWYRVNILIARIGCMTSDCCVSIVTVDWLHTLAVC